jgi:predicted nucleic acid-binding protein
MERRNEKIMLDTNVFYDFYGKTERLELVKPLLMYNEVYLSLSVYYELGSLFKRVFGSFATGIFLKMIKANCHILRPTEEQEDKAILVMQKYQFKNPNKEYTLTDSLQLVQAQDSNLKLFTSDLAMSFYDGAEVNHI